MTATFTIISAFGSDEQYHSCCSCCQGYCPMDDGSQTGGPDVLVSVGDYLSDRYVALLSELVEPGERVVLNRPVPPESFTVPEVEPDDESECLFVPSRALRLLALGIDIRQGSPKGPQHLYLNGRHVGWVMPAGDGVGLSEVRRLDQDSAQAVAEGGLLASIIQDLSIHPADALMALERAMP